MFTSGLSPATCGAMVWQGNPGGAGDVSYGNKMFKVFRNGVRDGVSGANRDAWLSETNSKSTSCRRVLLSRLHAAANKGRLRASVKRLQASNAALQVRVDELQAAAASGQILCASGAPAACGGAAGCELWGELAACRAGRCVAAGETLSAELSACQATAETRAGELVVCKAVCAAQDIAIVELRAGKRARDDELAAIQATAETCAGELAACKAACDAHETTIAELRAGKRERELAVIQATAETCALERFGAAETLAKLDEGGPATKRLRVTLAVANKGVQRLQRVLSVATGEADAQKAIVAGQRATILHQQWGLAAAHQLILATGHAALNCTCLAYAGRV